MGGSKDYNIQNSIWIGTDTITPTPPIRGHFKLSYTCKEYCILLGTAVIVIVWYLDLQLPVQSEPIATKVVSSNPVHGKVYSLQQYVIKFVSDLRQNGGFLQVIRFPPPIKLTTTI